MSKYEKFVFPISLVGTVIFGSAWIRNILSGTIYEGKEKMIGKTVIVTGANTGIGKETAIDLAGRGARVILACRDMEKCEKAREEIIEAAINKNIHCRKLDLASMQSIREFAENVKNEEKFLDVLINNAGIMRCPKMLTEDGFEMQLGVNHLGHFLLTILLLDKLKKSGSSRIVNVSSVAHKRGKMNFDDLNSEKNYDPGDAYNQSKLANVLFTRELANRLKGTDVTVNAVHPGLVKTEIARHTSLANSMFSRILLGPFIWLITRAPMRGAQTSIYCAVSSELEGVSGKYFSDCKEREVSEIAKDDEVAKRLWVTSEKWTKLSC